MSPNVTKNITSRIKRLVEDLQKYTVITYPNDHPPAHFHFEQGERIAVVELLPVVRIRENRGFNEAQLGEIMDLAIYFREFLLDRWDDLHRKRI